MKHSKIDSSSCPIRFRIFILRGGELVTENEAGASRVELIKITPMQHQQRAGLLPGLSFTLLIFWGSERERRTVEGFYV